MSKTPRHYQRAIARLRELLNAAEHAPGSTSFDPVFDAFTDLANDPRFTRLGDTDTADDWLPTLLAAACALHPSLEPRIELTVAIRLPDEGMLHGGLTFRGLEGVFFAFEQDKRGMLGLRRPDGTIEMIRITQAPFAPGEAPAHLGRTIQGLH